MTKKKPDTALEDTAVLTGLIVFFVTAAMTGIIFWNVGYLDGYNRATAEAATNYTCVTAGGTPVAGACFNKGAVLYR